MNMCLEVVDFSYSIQHVHNKNASDFISPQYNRITWKIMGKLSGELAKKGRQIGWRSKNCREVDLYIECRFRDQMKSLVLNSIYSRKDLATCCYSDIK